MADDLLRNALRMTIVRDLHALEREIGAYPDDESLWLSPSGISNSAGNLALHLAGNLRHFVGVTLGKTAYVRNRDAEFATRSGSRESLQSEIRATISDVDKTLAKMDDSQMDSIFPVGIGPSQKRVRTSDWLVHLAAHLAYHLGQIDYHRRLVTQDASTVDTVSVNDIPEMEG